MMQSVSSMSFGEFVAFQAAMQLSRYIFLAGGAFFIFWVWKRARFAARKIQKGSFTARQIRVEILHSLSTVLIFSLISGTAFYLHQTRGWFKFYGDWSERGTLYGIFSFGLLILVHDTYFYWMHRMLHIPFFYRRFHLVHHTSHSPTPLTIYSFHPGEAILEGMIVPIFALFVPMHFYMAFVFAFFTTSMNLIGHLGYELYGEKFAKTFWFKFLLTSTHHNLHHRHSNANYGFYFRIWDRICGTENPRYEAIYLENVTRKTDTAHKPSMLESPHDSQLDGLDRDRGVLCD